MGDRVKTEIAEPEGSFVERKIQQVLSKAFELHTYEHGRTIENPEDGLEGSTK